MEDSFYPATYLTDWIPRYREAILDWKKTGIGHIVVARPTSQRLQARIDGFLLLLRQNDLAYTLAAPNAFDLRDQIERCLKKRIRAGCAILEHELSHQLCNTEPDIIARLAKRCRFLFGRGRIHAPHFLKDNVRADVVGFDGDESALRIASDLGRRSEKVEAVRLVPRLMAGASLGEVFV
jgi:hypothetical protein